MRSFLALTIVALALAAARFSGRSPDDGLDQWPSHGGDAGGSRYSPVAQITRANVSGLARAWSYTGADGRQFVVIASGGHGKAGLPLGDEVVAFALPAGQ